MSGSQVPNPPKRDDLYDSIMDQLIASPIDCEKLKKLSQTIRLFWAKTAEDAYAKGFEAGMNAEPCRDHGSDFAPKVSPTCPECVPCREQSKQDNDQ